MEKPDDLDELLWATIPCQFRPEGLSVNCIKGLGQVDKYGIQIQVLLYAFLLDLSQCENHVDHAMPWVKSTLGYR